MTTDQPAVRDVDPEGHDEGDAETPESADSTESSQSTESAVAGDEERQPSWWHRDHPTFAALTGFFTGLLFVALVPAAYVGVLSLMFDNDRVEDLFPFVLVTLVVPLALVANHGPAGSASTSGSGWSSPRSSWSGSARWCCGTWSSNQG